MRRSGAALALHPVAGARLLAVRDTGGVERAADDLVADAGQVLDSAATDQDDGVLLKIVALTGNVGGDFHAVRQADTCDLAQSRVRLLWRDGGDTGADSTALRSRYTLLATLAGLEAGSGHLLLWPLTAFPDELIGIRHGGESYRLTRFHAATHRPGFAYPEGMSQPPILAVDIDGVISLFGFDEAPARAGVKFELVDGAMHCISLTAGDRLRRLSEHYELIWASGWEERANEILPEVLGLPRLETIDFDGAARWGTADWKLKPLERKAADRPLAWVDDSFDGACYRWAQERQAAGIPTLLVPTESQLGLEEAHTEALAAWAQGLARRAG